MGNWNEQFVFCLFTGNVRFYAGVQVDVTVYTDDAGVTKKAVTSLDLVNQDKDRDENSFDRQMKEYSKQTASAVASGMFILNSFSYRQLE
tara:strand:- start:850 stop:1119 length:270 start_codon:yes stop_codon:yes gene_type:complete